LGPYLSGFAGTGSEIATVPLDAAEALTGDHDFASGTVTGAFVPPSDPQPESAVNAPELATEVS